ncbi:hypothetical protein ACP70R_036390 [Stipagrostis hirtigluma subsp. patula]
MEKGAGTRRRRLVERGSDRLAFITGQTRDLPSDPLPDSPFGSFGAASTPLCEEQPSEGGSGNVSFSNLVELAKAEPRDVIPGFQPSDKVRQETRARTLSLEDELFRKFKTGSAVPEIQPLNETPVQKHDQEILSKKTSHDGVSSVKTSHDGISSVQPRRDAESRPRSAPPSQSNQADSAGWSMETLKELLNFTPSEITQAVSATESNRLLASIAIAFLVVLSNWGLDVGGTITRVLVGTRPLLFLIITEITIVVTLLMENKDPNARSRVGSNLGSADSLGQLLEIGLLLQKALGSLLIDCSVCAVIMICFLGF